MKTPTGGGKSAGERANMKKVNDNTYTHKGWTIEYTGGGYRLNRNDKFHGEYITYYARSLEHAKTVIANFELDIKTTGHITSRRK